VLFVPSESRFNLLSKYQSFFHCMTLYMIRKLMTTTYLIPLGHVTRFFVRWISQASASDVDLGLGFSTFHESGAAADASCRFHYFSRRCRHPLLRPPPRTLPRVGVASIPLLPTASVCSGHRASKRARQTHCHLLFPAVRPIDKTINTAGVPSHSPPHAATAPTGAAHMPASLSQRSTRSATGSSWKRSACSSSPAIGSRKRPGRTWA
jgi:hypothetical protein